MSKLFTNKDMKNKCSYNVNSEDDKTIIAIEQDKESSLFIMYSRNDPEHWRQINNIPVNEDVVMKQEREIIFIPY